MIFYNTHVHIWDGNKFSSAEFVYVFTIFVLCSLLVFTALILSNFKYATNCRFGCVYYFRFSTFSLPLLLSSSSLLLLPLVIFVALLSLRCLITFD